MASGLSAGVSAPAPPPSPPSWRSDPHPRWRGPALRGSARPERWRARRVRPQRRPLRTPRPPSPGRSPCPAEGQAWEPALHFPEAPLGPKWRLPKTLRGTQRAGAVPCPPANGEAQREGRRARREGGRRERGRSAAPWAALAPRWGSSRVPLPRSEGPPVTLSTVPPVNHLPEMRRGASLRPSVPPSSGASGRPPGHSTPAVPGSGDG